jgi:hypothetical protein
MADTWNHGPRRFHGVTAPQTHAKDEQTMNEREKLIGKAKAAQARVSELRAKLDAATLELKISAAGDDALLAMVADLEGEVEPLMTQIARTVSAHSRRESGADWQQMVVEFCKEHSLDSEDADNRMHAVKTLLKRGDLVEADLMQEA